MSGLDPVADQPTSDLDERHDGAFNLSERLQFNR
jgi:hypothetical protein